MDYDRLSIKIKEVYSSFPMSVYVPHWLQVLKYNGESYESALYALRSHGLEVWGNDYPPNMYWTVTIDGEEYRIDPVDQSKV